MPAVSLRRIPQGQHVLISGMTGSGKTTLLRRLAEARKWVICLDTKRELRWGWPEAERARSAFGMGSHAMLRPRSLAEVEYVFQRAYQEGGWTVCVDEVYMISSAPGSASLLTYPAGYVRALTAGRSRHVSVVTCTQRPRFLPLFAATESSHFFLFEPGSRDDARYLTRMAGIPGVDEDALADLRDHWYLYYSRPTRALVRSRLDLSGREAQSA